MAIIESAGFQPPAQLAALAAQRDKLAEQAADIAIAQATQMLMNMKKRFKGHNFTLNDGMGSTSIDIEPPMVDKQEERSFDVIMQHEVENEMRHTNDRSILQMLQACEQIFELSDYLNENFRYELGHIKTG